MSDAKLIEDLEEHITNLTRLLNYLKILYYREEFTTIANRPVVSMLITAGEFLITNLELQLQSYKLRG